MRKFLIFLVSIMLTAALSVAGTLAYDYTRKQYTSTDVADPIQVSINGGQKQVLLPAFEKNPTTNFDWSTATGALDKTVKVTNNGAADCYWRVVLGFEDNGSMFTNGDVLAQLTLAADDYTVAESDPVTIGGDQYAVVVVTAKKPLDPNTSASIPLKVAMRYYIDSTTIRPLGKDYTVLATAQAIWMDQELIQQVGQEAYNYEANAFGPEMLSTLLGNNYQDVLTKCLNSN
jgi:hypothetical protein